MTLVVKKKVALCHINSNSSHWHRKQNYIGLKFISSLYPTSKRDKNTTKFDV